MSPIFLAALYSNAATLFASVLLIVVIFLIGRVARLSQPLAITLAMLPALVLFAMDRLVMQGPPGLI